MSYDERHNEANKEGGRDGCTENYSWNCGVEGPTRKRTILQLRKRQMKNALALLLFSQGTPMLTAGDEFGQSREGNNNPYCQDNEISWLDWTFLEKNREHFEFVKSMIAFRMEHPVIRKSCGLCSIGFPEIITLGGDCTARACSVTYSGVNPKNREDDIVCLAVNVFWEDQDCPLPTLPDPYKWAVYTETAGEQDSPAVCSLSSIRLAPRSVAV